MLIDENVQSKKIRINYDALFAFDAAWAKLVQECRQVFEMQTPYQFIVYHCLRTYAQISLQQIATDVKIPLKAEYESNLTFDLAIYNDEVEYYHNKGKTELSISLLILIKTLTGNDDITTLNEYLEEYNLFEQAARMSGYNLIQIILVLDPTSVLAEPDILATQAEAKEMNIPFYYISKNTEYSYDLNAPDVQEDIKWEETTYKYKDKLDKWAGKITADYEAGLTVELDPDTL
jgi:hypothetical protein